MKKLLQIISICLFLCLSIPVFSGTIDTSSSTAATLITIVRADLNEATASFWADTEFTTWIDEAITEINNLARCLETTVSDVLLVANDYDYAFAVSYLDIESIIHDNGDTTSPQRIFSLAKADIKDIGHENEKGRPKIYTLWNDSIIVWPIPDSTQAGTTLHVYYIPMPSGVTATTSPIETPAYFDPAIVDYVKAKAYYKDNKSILGDKFMELFQARIANYTSNVVRRGDGPKLGQ